MGSNDTFNAAASVDEDNKKLFVSLKKAFSQNEELMTRLRVLDHLSGDGFNVSVSNGFLMKSGEQTSFAQIINFNVFNEGIDAYQSEILTISISQDTSAECKYSFKNSGSVEMSKMTTKGIPASLNALDHWLAQVVTHYSVKGFEQARERKANQVNATSQPSNPSVKP